LKTAKPFEISKQLVLQAYQQVKINGGSSGIDGETLVDFENNLKDNLYRIWNRMSSGTYFAPAVKGVLIPKKSGGTRLLGVPTIADRVAQTVVKMVLEPILEPVFDENSFGYRPNKSAHDAVAITRTRCWKYDWVVEFDIKGLFDNINHELLMKALKYHCKCAWVLLYVERWIKAPLQLTDGTIVIRDKGTPQGGVVSPILANLFLHYAFDAWVRRKLPSIPFCRYADDGLLHCRSKKQAEYVLKMIEQRFHSCGLEIHPDKSGIIYCKDKNRKEEFDRISFDFLGFTFRPRRCVNGKGLVHPNFLPAISRASKKAIYREIRSWHLQLMNEKSLTDIANMFNAVIRGWFNYYGKFYNSAMYSIGHHINVSVK
jgi:RNA-directed DNA polymerase